MIPEIAPLSLKNRNWHRGYSFWHKLSIPKTINYKIAMTYLEQSAKERYYVSLDNQMIYFENPEDLAMFAMEMGLL